MSELIKELEMYSDYAVTFHFYENSVTFSCKEFLDYFLRLEERIAELESAAKEKGEE